MSAISESWLIDYSILVLILGIFVWCFTIFLNSFLRLLLLFLLILLLDRQMDSNERSFIDFPELIIAQIGICELLDEVNPVIDGNLDKFSQVSVENILKSGDNSFKWTHLIHHIVAFKEVMVLPQLVLDLTN
jgi:hypothetical protein